MDKLVVSPGAGMMWGRSESLGVWEGWTGSARHLGASCGQTDVHLPPASGTLLLE